MGNGSGGDLKGGFVETWVETMSGDILDLQKHESFFLSCHCYFLVTAGFERKKTDCDENVMGRVLKE